MCLPHRYDSDEFEVEEEANADMTNVVLARVESMASVATDIGASFRVASTSQTSPTGGRVGSNTVLEGVVEVQEFDDDDDGIAGVAGGAAGQQPSPGPMRGRHIHHKRSFGAAAGQQGMTTAKRDASGRILVAPRAPVKRKLSTAISAASGSDSDDSYTDHEDEDVAGETKQAAAAGGSKRGSMSFHLTSASALSPKSALRREQEERERMEQALEKEEAERLEQERTLCLRTASGAPSCRCSARGTAVSTESLALPE